MNKIFIHTSSKTHEENGYRHDLYLLKRILHSNCVFHILREVGTWLLLKGVCPRATYHVFVVNEMTQVSEKKL